MDLGLISAVILIVSICTFLLINRKRIKIEGKFPFFYAALYRTKWGLDLMDWLAKGFPRFWRWFGIAGVWMGFMGMGFITFYLIYALLQSLISPELASTQAIGIVLPFDVKGAFYVPFSFWLVSIFIIAGMHELAHGIIARRYGVKVKSSGFAFMGILLPFLPAAFVEPDDKQLAKKPKMQQLSMFSSGAFMNIVFAFIVLLLLMPLTGRLASSLQAYDGVTIKDVDEGPLKAAGVLPGEVITGVDGKAVNTVEDFFKLTVEKKPGNSLLLRTRNAQCPDIDVSGCSAERNISLALDKGSDKASFGITVLQSVTFKEGVIENYGTFLPNIALWVNRLAFWLYVLSFGIGLFNLVPFGPFDGGKMFLLVLNGIFKKRHAENIWTWTTIFFIALLVVSIAISFLR